MTLFNDIIDFVKPGRKDAPPKKMPTATADFSAEREAPIRQDSQHPCLAYTNLKTRFRDIGRMNAIIETLGRDFLTAMPEGAYKSRLGQMAFLYRRMHEDLTSPEIQKLMDIAQQHQYDHLDVWDEWDEANIREMASMYRMYCHVDPNLMERKAHLSYEGRRHHRAIKESGDWEQAKGFLSAQIELHQKIADQRCEALDADNRYDMLMQEFMPSLRLSDVEPLLAQHGKALETLTDEIIAKQAKEPKPIPFEAELEFDPEGQMWLNRSLLEVIGFDFDRGGLYETGHNPVEGGTPEDTRLVISNVDDKDFMDSMKSALHEGGHGLYIQGLPRAEWRYQPVGMDLGAAVHESQALLVEMIFGRTSEFYQFLSPRLEGLFHGINSPALSAENLHRLKTRVSKTVDRKQADEVTYFYHVMLRYQLERDLIEGKLKIDDLPEAWVEGLHEMLGVTPENNLAGCLQDVHWFVGKFGYFPAYAVGHMMAAQLYEALRSAIPDLLERIAAGDYEEIKAWLHTNVYSRGRLMSAQKLIKQATGKKLQAECLEKHLRRRYLSNWTTKIAGTGR